MIINKLEFKNINSYGNNLQTLHFDNVGGLINLRGNNGYGKCLLKGTKVIMFDGTLKNVENIKIGDILMGPDSKKRTVLQLHSGETNMYKINQKKGINYIVTENHKLSLKKCGSYDNQYMTALEYLNLPKWKQKLYTGHISDSIEYKKKSISINPYILGVWLGDGTSKEPEITNIEPEIINEIYKFSKEIKSDIVKPNETSYRIVNKNNKKKIAKLKNGQIFKIFESFKDAAIYNNCSKQLISSSIKKNHKIKGFYYKKIKEKTFRDLLKDYNLLGNKHIPYNYIINSKQIRLELLAGIIDTDGYIKDNYITITQKNYNIVKDIEKICNSLGYKTNIYKQTKTIKNINFKGEYWTISISSNNLLEIPIRVKRKKQHLSKGNEQKDKKRTGINVSYYGFDKYYGFTLKENPLFLLEDYTVTHNSTIKQAIELCLFRKVQGKSGNRLALTKLPNRRNKALYTGIYFKNKNGDEIVMKQFIKPNKFEMTINGEEFDKKFKVLSEKEREKIIGYSFDVFKSFISLNINDFKNFISLSKSDKESLLNKLFNLSELDILYSITKDLDKSNQSSLSEYEFKIEENDERIEEFKDSIKRINENKNISNTNKKKELKEIILAKKPIFEKFNIEIAGLDEKIKKLNKRLYKLTGIKNNKDKEKNKLEFKRDDIKEKIDIFKSGNCPLCGSDLQDDAHLKELELFEQSLNDIKEKIVESDKFLKRCILENTKINNDKNEQINKKNSTSSQLSNLKIELAALNKEYKSIKHKSEVEDFSIEELENKISELKLDNKRNKEIINKLEDKSNTYDELKEIFSFDGIRKSLITNILKPINIYLNDFLFKLKSEYTAKLNDNFDAIIYELGSLEIDPETLSKGEDKKINLAIALSYLKIVLELKHTNIIFLDEIFDGVDPKNVDLLLDLLLEISLEYKINIIIVSFGYINLKNFKKIINVKKNIFSDISIENL